MNPTTSRMIVVSNRLPVSLNQCGDSLHVTPSGGGLVRALEQALERISGAWIGWPGLESNPQVELELSRYSGDLPFSLHPVDLTKEETDKFYHGFSNEIIWPLFHDLQSRCNFDPGYWGVYNEVNRKFAKEVMQHHQPEDLVWVHDYHLFHLAQYLREFSVDGPLAFYLHIPFPAPDNFEKLPWRVDILKALLQYDLVGFQTLRDLRNFTSCVRSLLPDASVARLDNHTQIATPEGKTIVGSFPISIDFHTMAAQAASSQVTHRCQELRACLPDIAVLGVDRLDYTKGIPERLKAFRQLLQETPELHRRISLLQVVVPSREVVPQYQELKLEVERLVSAINGEFSVPGWTPAQYVYRNLDIDELLAYYQAADVALITPLKDGMNLVAKEYCASRVNNDGVLILSEFAGAAAQLRSGALLVNPYDVLAVADAIRTACCMKAEERRSRMRKMRSGIRRHDVFRWLNDFQRALPLQVPNNSNVTSIEGPDDTQVFPQVALSA